jgi:hypothetical protein
MPIVFWGQGAVSVAVLLARFLPDRWRGWFVRAACGVGVGFGLALFLERRSGDAWRTTLIEPTAAALAGIASAAAWVVAAALVDEEDRWRAASLVGLGGSALALFAAARWTVPALLFWSLTSLVAGALAFHSGRRAELWIGLVLSDLCFTAGLIGHVVDTDTWGLPNPAPGRAFWLLLAAAVLRVGVVPRFGLWKAVGTPAAAALPLLVGGGFIVVAGPGGRPEAWAAVGLLVAGLVQAVWGAVQSRLAPADFAGWAPSVCLALLFIEPRVGALAGAAAILSVAALGVWPWTSGAAQPERGLLLTLAPPMAGFGALVASAREAFGAATESESLAVQIPSTVIAALIPLVMAAGALLGARIGRERSSGSLDPWPLAATWLLVAASVALGVTPEALELPDDVVGTQQTFLVLSLVALAAGAVAGWLWSLRHPDHSRAPKPEPLATVVGPRTSNDAVTYQPEGGTSLVERMLTLVALVLAVAVFTSVGWVTYEGLSQGFL